MRIFTEHRIENGLAAGNKGIPTNGESVKVRCPAAVLLFIRRYQNIEPLLYAIRTFRYDLKCNLAEHCRQWQRTRNFPGADLNPNGHSPDFLGGIYAAFLLWNEQRGI